jgi:hypothetical protein
MIHRIADCYKRLLILRNSTLCTFVTFTFLKNKTSGKTEVVLLYSSVYWLSQYNTCDAALANTIKPR